MNQLKKLQDFFIQKRNSFFFKLVLCVVISILPFVFLELFLRVRDVFAQKKIFENKQSAFNRYSVAYTYAPFILWRAVPNQQTESFSTNSLGLRSPELDKSSVVDKIVFLGGSTMWGYGVTNNEASIAYQVKKIIKEKYKKDIEIINLSENGYNSTQELILWKDIVGLKPKVVVHFNGYNDLYTGHSGKPAGWNHNFVYEDLLLREKSDIVKSIGFMLIKDKVNQLYLSHWFNYKLEKLIPHQSSQVKRTALKDVVDTYKTNMLIVTQLAKENGINLVIVNQPNIFVDRKVLTTNEDEIQHTFEEYYDNPRNTYLYFSQGYAQQQQALTELPKSKNLTIIDGTTFFLNRSDEIYLDPVHINDVGSTVVADKLASLLAPKIH